MEAVRKIEFIEPSLITATITFLDGSQLTDIECDPTNLTNKTETFGLTAKAFGNFPGYTTTGRGSSYSNVSGTSGSYRLMSIDIFAPDQVASANPQSHAVINLSQLKYVDTNPNDAPNTDYVDVYMLDGSKHRTWELNALTGFYSEENYWLRPMSLNWSGVTWSISGGRY